MKQLLPLFLFLLPCFAWAQYPTNGNQKITLGEQTTADGLIYRGVIGDTALITPLSDTSAYIILDTVNHRFYNYNRATNVWSLAGGTSVSVSGTSGQVAYFDGSTSVTGDVGLIYSAANKTLGINTATTSGANLIIKNSQEPTRNTSWLTNQTFGADTTNWTKGTGWTFNGTVAVATAATEDLTYTTLPDTIISGRAYEITYTQSGYSTGTATIALGNVTLAVPQYNVTANKMLLTPTSESGGFRITTSTYTGNFDNISIVEISNFLPVLQGTQLSTTATINNEIRATSTSYFTGGGGRYNTGSNNISQGTNAGLNNTSGIQWVAQGFNAGRNNITGNNWVAQGNFSGFNNTSGSSWIAQGTDAGRNNTTGSSWIAQGNFAGGFNTIGNFWIAQGLNAGRNNTTGDNWIAQGNSAAFNNIAGSNWIAQGFEAGRRYSNAVDSATFTNSVYIGALTRAGGTTGQRTNENVFGYAAIGNGDNTVTLGNSSILSHYLSGTTASRLFINNASFGVTSPTARVHLAAGTATASTAPLKFTSGTNLTTAEAGAMEFNGTNLLFSPSTVRHTVNHGLTGSATLNFLSTNAQSSADLTINVTGAADGDVVSLGVPNVAVNANTSYSAWVSAANTVTVRFNNYSSGTVDPASGSFKVFVTK